MSKIYLKIFLKNVKKEILFSCVVPLAFKKIKYYFKDSNYKFFEIKKFNLKNLLK